ISSLYKENNEKLIIRIKDTGIGIDSKFLPELFDAFRQESLGYSKSQQGAGLGLPLAKKLMKLIDGEIQVKSKKGEGSVVSLFIPYLEDKSSKKTPKKEQKEETAVTSLNLVDVPRILLVEDDKMNRLVFSKMMANKSKLIVCVDGDEALESLNKHIQNKEPIDIVLMDINLPAPWDGIEVMKEMKIRHQEAKTIPFIAQTAYAMAGDKERMLQAGFDDYISKPIDRLELYNVIENNLKP
ncbi:MAG: response regulator, partial [Bacteroidales bacterium]|nr:response regulator [Bacteroidales bacterium]